MNVRDVARGWGLLASAPTPLKFFVVSEKLFIGDLAAGVGFSPRSGRRAPIQSFDVKTRTQRDTFPIFYTKLVKVKLNPNEATSNYLSSELEVLGP